MTSICIVHDDQNMRQLMEISLKRVGYQTFVTNNYLHVKHIVFSGQIDLVILNCTTEGQEGISLCHELRQKSNIPIIFLSEQHTHHHQVKALMLGADDYIMTPFHVNEFLARVNAILRRVNRLNHEEAAKFIKYGAFSLDEVSRKVMVHQQKLDLTLKEYRLMNLFIHFPNVVFSRKQLLELIWNGQKEGNIRTIDTHIKTLRLKLATISVEASKTIQTVWGIGYLFELSIDDL